MGHAPGTGWGRKVSLTNLTAIYILWYRDLLRFWRDKARLLTSFIQPFLFLVIFGTGIGASMLLLAPEADFNYIQFIFPGIIGMVVLFTGIMSGVSIVWDREFGFLKEVLVAPMSRISVAIGKTLGGATIATIQGVIMLVFIPFVGISISAVQVFLLIPLMFVFAFSLTAMGILIASRIKTMETFQVVMQLLLFPLFFLSPAMFPIQFLPTWLSTAIKLNPVSYGIDSMRQAALGSQYMPIFGINLFGHTMSAAEDIALVALFGLIMAILGAWSFGKQE
jgi:ABC-2 type transport system permease protein